MRLRFDLDQDWLVFWAVNLYFIAMLWITYSVAAFMGIIAAMCPDPIPAATIDLTVSGLNLVVWLIYTSVFVWILHYLMGLWDELWTYDILPSPWQERRVAVATAAITMTAWCGVIGGVLRVATTPREIDGGVLIAAMFFGAALLTLLSYRRVYAYLVARAVARSPPVSSPSGSSSPSSGDLP